MVSHDISTVARLGLRGVCRILKQTRGPSPDERSPEVSPGTLTSSTLLAKSFKNNLAPCADLSLSVRGLCSTALLYCVMMQHAVLNHARYVHQGVPLGLVDALERLPSEPKNALH